MSPAMNDGVATDATSVGKADHVEGGAGRQHQRHQTPGHLTTDHRAIRPFLETDDACHQPGELGADAMSGQDWA